MPDFVVSQFRVAVVNDKPIRITPLHNYGIIIASCTNASCVFSKLRPLQSLTQEAEAAHSTVSQHQERNRHQLAEHNAKVHACLNLELYIRVRLFTTCGTA